MNSLGTKLWKDDHLYKGYYKDKLRHGIVIFIQSNSVSYVGEWRDDKKNGLGKYSLIEGRTHHGLWENNRLIGNGHELIHSYWLRFENIFEVRSHKVNNPLATLYNYQNRNKYK